jgi:prepilin-type N-terminal cleavage/methylation domain-containing protein
MRKQQQGFTLVEIAIVLVIIGLLLGGILKGQEMITQAKIKNVVADFSGISAAYYGYQDRYRAIPGDDANAPTRWGVAASANPGDGIVQGTYNDTSVSPSSVESRLWWLHLRRAGFVGGTGDQQPTNAVIGMIGVQTGDGTSAPPTTPGATLGGLASLIMCSANLPDKIAIAVDSQMDDGQPGAGGVRAFDQTTAGPNPSIGAGASAPANYQETGTTTYVLCRQI